jgi:divalent metal cation (Fe/Co/Zn/Cd) transporter
MDGVLQLKAAERGKRLEYFTVVWNSLEALVAIVSGLIAGSISLTGFGVDSLIEVTSGGALLWRMTAESDRQRRELIERSALRIVGGCFLALAIYVTYEGAYKLVFRELADRSVVGIGLATVSLIAMPILARAKRRVSKELGSAAMAADAKQTDFCAYLSAILLTGLSLNAFFGIWWADPVAGLAMVPLIAREGLRALQGKTCCHS